MKWLATAAVNYILGCEETLQVDDIPDPDIASKIEAVRMRILLHFKNYNNINLYCFSYIYI